MPQATIIGDAAAGDEAVDVGVKVELLRPGVQHGEHPNGTADITRVAGKFDDRFSSRLHQDGIAVALVGAHHRAQFVGHVTVTWKYGLGSVSAWRACSQCSVWSA